MTSQNNAHRFFYDLERRSSYVGVRTNFRKAYHHEKNIIGVYYSYSTEIALRRYDKNKKEALIISDYPYSHTTCKHYRELHSACPHYNIYTVPYIDIDNMDKMSQKELNEILHNDPISYKTKKNKEKALKVIYQFDKYDSDIEHLKEASKVRKSKDMDKILNIINADRKDQNNFIKEYELYKEQEKMRKRKAELNKYRKQIKMAEQLIKTYCKNDYDKIKFVFETRHFTELRKEEREAIRTYENCLLRKDLENNYLSYVWETDEVIKTSQGVIVEPERVKNLLRLWKKKEKILGQSVDGYSIVRSDDKYIKVGCHLIPIWNIEALCQHFEIQ